MDTEAVFALTMVRAASGKARRPNQSYPLQSLRIALDLKALPGFWVAWRDSRHACDFAIRDVGSMYSFQIALARRDEEHISAAQKLLCADVIEDNTTVHTSGNLEGDTSREVCFDEPCVMTLIEGLCVARMRCMPTALAI